MVQFRHDWLGNIDIIQQEMSRLLDHFAGSKVPLVRFSHTIWEPSIDVYETKDELVLTVELAGVRESDMRIIVHPRAFIIQGERKKTLPGGRKGTYHQMEITSGYFERRITLPVAVDAANARASCDNGLVEIIIPKVTKERSLKVSIRTS